MLDIDDRVDETGQSQAVAQGVGVDRDECVIHVGFPKPLDVPRVRAHEDGARRGARLTSAKASWSAGDGM